jgi:SAM-dependent methyltransferase
MGDRRPRIADQLEAILRLRSKKRWLQATPTSGLTWGKELPGEPFVAKLQAYGVLSAETSILEIGPGYGRLLKACITRGLPFSEYYALDISAQNIAWLQHSYQPHKVHFIVGDTETVSLPRTFDIVISSLTFKHLYPSFEQALRNISGFVTPGGRFLFDLREGRMRLFDPRDMVTYVRWYSRAEVRQILSTVGLTFVTFDHVQHDPSHRRLLVVAEKPG